MNSLNNIQLNDSYFKLYLNHNLIYEIELNCKIFKILYIFIFFLSQLPLILSQLLYLVNRMQESRTERKNIKSTMTGYSNPQDSASTTTSTTASNSSHRIQPYTSALSSQLSLAHGQTTRISFKCYIVTQIYIYIYICICICIYV